MNPSDKMTVINCFSAANASDLPRAETWNGAESLASSGESLTNLFFRACRNLDQSHFRDLLNKAWSTDPLLTMRLLAYIRHIKGGKGERQLGRWGLDWLATRSPRDLVHNLRHYVGTFGRWDDLVDLIGHAQVTDRVLELVANQLHEDLDALKQNRPISLCAKWIPSERKRSDRCNGFNRRLATFMKLSRKELRGVLTQLRKEINLLETHLCEKTLEEVNYSEVPSVAMNRHGKDGHAFPRRDAERFAEYKDQLERGTAKVNTGALYPHQVVEKYLGASVRWGYGSTPETDQLTEAQWKGVLERLTAEERGHLAETLAVVDVSGSMYGGKKDSSPAPIIVALALGLLVTEMNPNETFKDLVLTFSESPQFHRVEGSTLRDRVANLKGAKWGGSTNFEATFRLILKRAQEFGLQQSMMPRTLLVISDMQFDSAGHLTNYEALRQAYQEAGYEIPKLVFWNVNGSTSDFPVSANQSGTALVSGFSIEILRDVLSGEEITPFRVMMRAVDRPEYRVIERAPPDLPPTPPPSPVDQISIGPLSAALATEGDWETLDGEN
jgi:hypothetical protein